ncbi:MAG TPA: RdgB/HAM1 family non-canonical purine NTP pyrophosphatase [Bryobacteraceae bacterium]|nr:RdgB/HAM1 family non-canonical purine NTP pyrophosphatase [Bryobacteraceae bacterium]
MKVLCATTNSGKLREFRKAAEDWFELESLPELDAISPPEETGSTFEENAILKARYYGDLTPEMLFAEDSGLEVDALGGAPGVCSARYSGPGATDASNNDKLLRDLEGVVDRRARYVCVIALVRAGELLSTFRGTVEGTIAVRPSGSQGFGYDPLFWYAPFGCTFAEVTAERKQTVSHRGHAVAELVRYMSSRSSTPRR